MQNALLKSEGKTNQGFMKGGTAITWLIIIEAYKRELLIDVPKTDLTRMAVYPDSWSKMNAKAPFTFNTITEMMTNLASKLGCVDDFVLNKISLDNCEIHLHHLMVLRNANTLRGNNLTSMELATIEYCTHVGIIFIETLMNAELSLCRDNICQRENLVEQSMKYFEEWKHETDEAHNQKAFLSMITFNDLRICVNGFFAYAHLVLESGIEFVPMLHSNTSILESLFSQVRSMDKESARDYPKAISTIHAGSEIVALHGNQCKSYSDKDIIPGPKGEKILIWKELLDIMIQRERRLF